VTVTSRLIVRFDFAASRVCVPRLLKYIDIPIAIQSVVWLFFAHYR